MFRQLLLAIFLADLYFVDSHSIPKKPGKKKCDLKCFPGLECKFDNDGSPECVDISTTTASPECPLPCAPPEWVCVRKKSGPECEEVIEKQNRKKANEAKKKADNTKNEKQKRAKLHSPYAVPETAETTKKAKTTVTAQTYATVPTTTGTSTIPTTSTSEATTTTTPMEITITIPIPEEPCNLLCNVGSHCMITYGEAKCVTEKLKCNENEEVNVCGNLCENKCQSLCEPLACPFICAPPACACKDGFYRDSNGTCVTSNECPECPCTSTAETVQVTEIPVSYATPEVAVTTTSSKSETYPAKADEGYGSDCLLLCIEGSYCLVAPDGPRCVPVCGKNEVLKFLIEGHGGCSIWCDQKCESAFSSPPPCPIECAPEVVCACDTGFYRNDEDKCVPKEECKKSEGYDSSPSDNKEDSEGKKYPVKPGKEPGMNPCALILCAPPSTCMVIAGEGRCVTPMISENPYN